MVVGVAEMLEAVEHFEGHCYYLVVMGVVEEEVVLRSTVVLMHWVMLVSCC